MLTIRAATVADLSVLTSLWHEKMVLQADRRVALARDARQLWVEAARGWLDEGRCGFLIADLDGAAVGYIVGWIEAQPGVTPSQIGLISEMALDAHGYHGGTGRALVTALREWFDERGAKQMAVRAGHSDAVAQAFWRSLGAAEWMDVLWIK